MRRVDADLCRVPKFKEDMTNPYDIKKTRILPMDKKEEFKTAKEVRKFLAVELI